MTSDPLTPAAPKRELRFGHIPRAPRLSDAVADTILRTIVSQGLKPGDELPSERELGEHFGVSRTVIREAVRVLVAKGVVEARSGSGLRVSAVDGATVTESLSLYLGGGATGFEKAHEVRRSIEIEMAGVAAQRATPENISTLQEIHRTFVDARDDVETAARIDLEFHATIAQATQNELFTVLLNSLGPFLLQIRRENLAAGSWETTVAEHAKILECIASGDVEGARLAMRSHLDNVADWHQRPR